MSISLKLALSGISLEIAALGGALAGGSSDALLAATLSAHLLAAILLAVALFALLPAALRQPPLPGIALFAAFIFCLPLLGPPGLLLAILRLRQGYRADASSNFRSVRLPEIDPHQQQAGGFRQAGLGAFLSNGRAPEATRMKALVALQNVPGRVASPLLRNVLADPSEDIRLLAYGMLDNQEKRLNDQIHRERLRLAGSERDAAARRLGDLYWELVYHDLVQGDLRLHALKESLAYTEETLRGAPADTGLYLRLGRLHQMRGEAEAARTAYEQALALGMPRSRIVPYLAELAFDQRDFATVRTAMQELGDWRSLPRLRPIIEYWSAS